jgi:TetR/AcrR family transcriptional regulator, transcriptional repressor for nem operon
MRPKTFDPAKTVAAALPVFWEQGYEGTNMPELLDAMGLGKASFYNAFISKHSVFLAVLDTYFSFVNNALRDTLRGHKVRSAALECLVDAVLSVARKPGSFGDWRGCLIGNTSLEMGAHDPVIRQKLALGINVLKRHFEAALLLPDEAGQRLTAELASAHALQGVAAVQGLLILGKSGVADADILAARKAFITSLTMIGTSR